MNGVYTTLEAVGRQLATANPGAVDSSVTNSWLNYKGYVTDLIYQVSDMMFNECNRVFVPYYQAVLYPFASPKTFLDYQWQGGMFQNACAQLILNDDLHELISASVTINSTTTSITGTDLMTLTDGNASAPFYSILINNQANYFSAGATAFTDGITITGNWGFISEPSMLYKTVETITGTLTSSATTITVANGTLYETLGYIKIDSEVMLITGISVNTLTVERGALGTTAAAHNNPYIIKRMYIDDAVVLLATRIVAWFYQKRNDLGDRIQFSDGSSLIPDSMPKNLQAQIAKYTRTKYAQWGG